MNNNNSDEKRQELRLNAQETLFIEVDSGDENAQPQIIISNSVDISANGIQVVIDRPLFTGSIHRLCLQLGDSEQKLYLTALIAWSRLLTNDEGFAVGMQVLESQGTDVQRWKEWIAERCALDN